MGSSGNVRRKLPAAGGILSIITGTFEVIGGGALVALVVSPDVKAVLLYPLPLMVIPPLFPAVPTWLIAVGVPLLIVGVMAILGGISAARRKSFGLSLAGAICAVPSLIFGLSLAGAVPAPSSVMHNLRLVGSVFCILPSGLLGIAAVILVALGKREFGVKARVISEVSDH